MGLIQNTLKLMKYFHSRVRDCLLLFYTPPLAPQGIVSPPPLWLWHQRKKGGKVGKGEEGQSEIPGEGCVACASFIF